MNIKVTRYELKGTELVVFKGYLGEKRVCFAMNRNDGLVPNMIEALRTKHIWMDLADADWVVGDKPMLTRMAKDAPLQTKVWEGGPLFSVKPLKEQSMVTPTDLKNKPVAALVVTDAVKELLAQFQPKEVPAADEAPVYEEEA